MLVMKQWKGLIGLSLADAGRKAVLDHRGGERILDVLRKSLGRPSPDSGTLRSAVTGFILNLINDYEPSQNKVRELNSLSLSLDPDQAVADLC